MIDNCLLTQVGKGILTTVGNTPLVELTNLYQDVDFRVFAKLEALNPGGSIKDRPALSILQRAQETGEVLSGSVVIESSSGNMGIGLAQACAYHGLRFICVVDPRTTAQNTSILQAYGAEIEYVREPDPVTGEFLDARLNRVRQLLADIPFSFWPDQYSNVYNPLAHHQTIREVIERLNGKLDYLFCATSTCGTLRGCVEYLQMRKLKTKVIAVDALGSVIFSDRKAKRLLPGHGAAVRPPLFQPGLADDFILVNDLDCIVGCRRLVRREAILAGSSSGGVLTALEYYRDRILPGSNCVLIFPDRGERYLDTIYSDEWVNEHFGEVSHLWADAAQTQMFDLTF
jgi:2,3-diaminopropionate biosynthesis protein SbnA